MARTEIDLDLLKDDFLNGSDWDITDGNDDATITGLRAPTADDDAATKKYVDDNAGGGSAADFLEAYNASASSSFSDNSAYAAPLDTTSDSSGSSFTQTSSGIRADFTGTVNIEADATADHPAGGGQDYLIVDITLNNTPVTGMQRIIFLRQATGYGGSCSWGLNNISVSTNDIIRIEASRQVNSATWRYIAGGSRLKITKRS